MTVKHKTDVLVVGAGPAGLLAALQLARNGVQCMIVERNLSETKWPKMDLTNCRSMEYLRRLGVAEGWKEIGVPPQYSMNVLFSTGLGEGGEAFAQWTLPSPQTWREKIRKGNDGSQPYESWIRGAQNLFEAYLRPQLDLNPLVDVYYGMRFESLTETDEGVESHLIENSNTNHIIESKYVIGCDGGGSRVRRCLGIDSIGGPVPGAMFLIHFKSRDLTVLHRQGQFWHIFFTTGSVLISQNELDTWTLHTPIAVDADISDIDPMDTISKELGGSIGSPVPIKIDEILVTSTWRPNIYLAANYISPGARVFLAGDSAHQLIPTGGYGMNTAVGDSFDIGWKLAAVLKGYAGTTLLASYEAERRPVAIRNMELSGKHWSVHAVWQEWARNAGNNISCQTSEGRQVRQRIKEYVQANDLENQSFGVELDYRYTDSPVVIADEETDEPPWNISQYTPSTWPGARAPHLWLKEGNSIFELFGFGPEFTLIDFTMTGVYADHFARKARELNIPLKTVLLSDEEQARKIWERDAVLVRPDDHVAWRAKGAAGKMVDASEVEAILMKAVGRAARSPQNKYEAVVPDQPQPFTGTVGNVDRDSVKMMGSFQNNT